MSSIVFVTWDGGGNVPPLLAIAGELVRDGHTVRVLGHPVQREAIEAAGLEFEAYRSAKPWSALDSRSALADSLAIAGVFTDRGIGNDLVESLAARPADTVIIDGLLIGAMHSASQAGISYLILVHTLRHVMVQTVTTGPLSFIMRLSGLDPRRLYASAQGEIVSALRSLEPAGSSIPATAEFVGPILPAVAEPVPVSGTPLVLVSLSTTAIPGQDQVLQRVIDAVAQLPVRAVVTTGPAVDPGALRAPDNVEVHRLVPHSRLMPRASLVVGHGGHGTTMLALAHGIPMVLLPMHPGFDQPAIAGIVEGLGAGSRLSRRASATRIADEIQRVLASDQHRAAAARLAGQIRMSGGARAAASIAGGARASH